MGDTFNVLPMLSAEHSKLWNFLLFFLSWFYPNVWPTYTEALRGTDNPKVYWSDNQKWMWICRRKPGTGDWRLHCRERGMWMMAGMKRTHGDRNGPYCAGDWIPSRGGERNPGWLSNMAEPGGSRLLTGNKYRWEVLEGGQVTQRKLILRRTKAASRAYENPKV